MLQTEYLLEIGKLLVFSHLFNSRVTHVARFAAEWKHAERVAADDAQARDSERLR